MVDQVYTIKEVAEMLKLSERNVRKLLKLGQLPKLDMGVRNIRIPAQAVEKLMRTNNE